MPPRPDVDAVLTTQLMVMCSRRSRSATLTTLLALLSLAQAAGAQVVDTARKTIRATPRTSPLQVDGRLTEPDWARAEVASGFLQREPDPNEPATQKTEVRILVDDGALYVGARLFDSEPRRIAAQLGRRDPDDLFTDAFHVAIDSYFDRRTAFRFSVTPAGVQSDAIAFNDNDEDENWDAVYESAATIDSSGWTAELRIPLSQLRYGRLPPGETRRWGIQFVREIARLGEESFWTATPPTQPGIVSRFGDLIGLDSLGTPARLEILPYVSSQLTRLPDAEANALVDATRTSARAGVDVRYGLPRGLTLTATINPDFGQVEVDPAVVNLTAFETFFSERRPFFLEGGEIFRFGETVSYNQNEPPQPFYSRRIGRAPRGSLEGDNIALVDEPSQTDILAAAKVSGKTPGGWSLGLLGAITDEMRARYRTQDGAVGSATVEPTAGYVVGRLSKDLRDGNTVLGLALTGAARDVDGGFEETHPRSALTAGVTAEHAWHDRTWTASGYYSRSRVAAFPAFMSALQRSNTHAFHRPDRERTRYDPTRDLLAGHFYALSLAKTGGKHWLGSITYEETEPGYDVNELGFQRRSDLRSVSSALRYQQTSPQGPFRNWLARTSARTVANFDGDVIEQRLAVNADAQWRNFWNTDVGVSFNPDVYDDRLTRGGPLARRPAWYGFDVSFSTDDRQPYEFDVGYDYEASDDGGWGHSFDAEVNLRPSSAVQLSIGAEYSRDYNYRQFVTSVADSLARQTFGRRYVFGDIEQHELGISTRVSWTFSPKLSLQVFAQPLVSAGRFDRYKEFRAPKTSSFDVYGSDRGTISRDRSSQEVLVDPDAAGPSPAFQFDEREFTV
ncbi:MAG: DUF5916 domain-containing protein, partial [Gemmatimonadaceae bacterium]